MKDRVTADFIQAAGLLEADLVWSTDFDALRAPLAEFLRFRAGLGKKNHPALIEIVDRLLEEENNFTGE